MPPQQQSRPLLQQQVLAGFMAKGPITSLIYTPTTKWIAIGNWSMNINNGSLTSFNTNMIWFNNNVRLLIHMNFLILNLLEEDNNNPTTV